ncbi:MAG: hypothetical protein AABO41_12820 [Acidobacteriota bacterium]
MRLKLWANALIALLLALPLAAEAQNANPARRGPQSGTSAEAPHFVKAFVADDRLSVVRKEPDLRSQVVQRLRLRRPVFIIGSSISKAGEPKFYRVAVTRRTRGWIHAAAVAIPSRAGEDKRVLQLAEKAVDGLDRIALCLLLTESFKNSSLVQQALLMLAAEAERSVSTLSKRVAKRVAAVGPRTANASQRDYYLSDASLDRFSRLGVSFDFDDATGEYIYDGAAYRTIIKRFPASDSAKIARERLELVRQRLARRE